MLKLRALLALRNTRQLLPRCGVILSDEDLKSKPVADCFARLPFYLRVEVFPYCKVEKPLFWSDYRDAALEEVFSSRKFENLTEAIEVLQYLATYDKLDAVLCNEKTLEVLLELLYAQTLDGAVNALLEIPERVVTHFADAGLLTQKGYVLGVASQYVLAGSRSVYPPIEPVAVFCGNKDLFGMLCHVWYWVFRASDLFNHTSVGASNYQQFEALLATAYLERAELVFCLLFNAAADSKYVKADRSDYLRCAESITAGTLISFAQTTAPELLSALKFYRFAGGFEVPQEMAEKLLYSFNLNYLHLDHSAVELYGQLLARAAECTYQSQLQLDSFCRFIEIAESCGEAKPSAAYFAFKYEIEENRQQIESVCRAKDILAQGIPVLSQLMHRMAVYDYATLFKLLSAFAALTNLPLPVGPHAFKNRYSDAFTERDLNAHESTFQHLERLFITPTIENGVLRVPQAAHDDFERIMRLPYQLLVVLNGSEITARLAAGIASTSEIINVLRFYKTVWDLGVELSSDEQVAITDSVFLAEGQQFRQLVADVCEHLRPELRAFAQTYLKNGVREEFSITQTRFPDADARQEAFYQLRMRLRHECPEDYFNIY